MPEPRTRSQLGEWLQVISVVGLELLVIVALILAGPYLGSVSLGHLSHWLRATGPGDALTALLRLGGLVVAAWLFGTTVLYLALSLLDPERTPGRTANGWLPPAIVRRVIDGVATASLLVASIGSTATVVSAAPMAAVAAPLPSPAARPNPNGTAVAHPQGANAALTDPTWSPPRRRAGPATTERPRGRHLPHPGLVRHNLEVVATEGDRVRSDLAPEAAGLPAGTKYVVVKPGDCLSVLAQDHLGNWQRDHQITAVNLGRQQHDGRRFTDEHWIYPGWILVMPADATGTLIAGSVAGPATLPATPPAAVPATPPAAVAPAPSALTPAAPARPVPASATPATATPAPANDSQPAPTAQPGPAGSGPATAQAGPSAPAGPSAQAGPSEQAEPSAPAPTMIALPASRTTRARQADVGALAGAGLVGAALLGTVQVLRRRQAQRRPPTRRVRLPEPGLANLELAVERATVTDRSQLIERAVASLCLELQRVGRTNPAPVVLGLLVDDVSVEVLLDSPSDAPSPWRVVAGGFRWRIEGEFLPPFDPSLSAALPALASVGQVAGGSADALVNLEAAGLVGVGGGACDAAGLLHAIAIHLQGAPWARAVNLILVGFPAGLGELAHVRCVPSLASVADELRSTAQVMAAAATQLGCTSPFEARLRSVAGDGWPPCVVLSARPPDAAELELLAEVTGPGTGVVAVAAGASPPGAWHIDASSKPCTLGRLRLAVHPSALTPEIAAAFSKLLQIGRDLDGATLDDPPYDRVELSAQRPEQAGPPGPAPAEAAAQVTRRPLSARLHVVEDGSDSAPSGLPELPKPAIRVRVLGTVEIDGASEFRRAKSRELVVYLAMHPSGVGEAELDEALWGTAGTPIVAPSTRDATVSVARTAVGGAARLLPAQGQGREKRYQLGPAVCSDWADFCLLHRFGKQHASFPALRAALELVRGRPFQGVVSGRTYGWVHTEGHQRHLEAEVADAADLAAGLCLRASDPAAARWAARQGLVAEPYTERLWVRLMEAADALGESQEVELIMDELDGVLELEGDFSGLHPATLAAYDRLSRRHRHTVGGGVSDLASRRPKG